MPRTIRHTFNHQTVYQTTYDISDEPLTIHKSLFDKLQKEENFSDALALYLFYYYTAKWQKTNRPKCTTSYTAKGLHWGEDKVRKIKKTLLDLLLIEEIQERDSNTQIIKGHYIQVRFIWSHDAVESHPQSKPEGGLSQSVDNQETNALSLSSVNALSLNKTPNVTEKRDARVRMIEAAKDRIKDLPDTKFNPTVNNIYKIFLEMCSHLHFPKPIINRSVDNKVIKKALAHFEQNEDTLKSVFEFFLTSKEAEWNRHNQGILISVALSAKIISKYQANNTKGGRTHDTYSRGTKFDNRDNPTSPQKNNL